MSAVPIWVRQAYLDLGVAEVKGAAHNPRIISWLERLKLWWRDDETAWCGVFAMQVMQACKLEYPSDGYRAKAWASWGKALLSPRVGCIVVFTREGGGHVGIVVGQDQRGNLMVLGGNQGDKVSIAPFAMSRVTAYRWPREVAIPAPQKLPVITSDGKLSTNEA